ncbi:hypothetical protein LCGC14_2266070 [marine sediment metagenome]|uniref:NAD-dependent epimerase/dehydratase domain-containing protein n=1 Tax=marine sediment metagenome TaxID=412755 RepID=A0A0F9DKK2_9ZZZZ
MPKLRILVTGGAGFIGANAVARYMQRSHDVVVLDNLSRPKSEKNLEWLREQGEFEFINADIRDHDLCTLFHPKKPFDIVLHLAAQTAVTTSIVNPAYDFEVNATGTLNLLEAIRKSGQDPIFIYSSTNKVYGGLENYELTERELRYEFIGGRKSIAEHQPLDFHSPYGCSKGCADQYVRDYARIYGLRTVVLRQSCIYGPHQFGVEDQGWIAWLTIAALTHETITIYGDGKQVRDILYIDDLLDCFDKVVENIRVAKGEVYNIGGGHLNQLSLLEFMNVLSELGRRLTWNYLPMRQGDQLIYVSDITKAHDELSWAPRTQLDEGLRRLYNWIKGNFSC